MPLAHVAPHAVVHLGMRFAVHPVSLEFPSVVQSHLWQLARVQEYTRCTFFAVPHTASALCCTALHTVCRGVFLNAPPIAQRPCCDLQQATPVRTVPQKSAHQFCPPLAFASGALFSRDREDQCPARCFPGNGNPQVPTRAWHVPWQPARARSCVFHIPHLCFRFFNPPASLDLCFTLWLFSVHPWKTRALN